MDEIENQDTKFEIKNTVHAVGRKGWVFLLQDL
jgi:hypothetical protein